MHIFKARSRSRAHAAAVQGSVGLVLLKFSETEVVLQCVGDQQLHTAVEGLAVIAHQEGVDCHCALSVHLYAHEMDGLRCLFA